MLTFYISKISKIGFDVVATVAGRCVACVPKNVCLTPRDCNECDIYSILVNKFSSPQIGCLNAYVVTIAF